MLKKETRVAIAFLYKVELRLHFTPFLLIKLHLSWFWEIIPQLCAIASGKLD